jgi:DNA-binding NtrC family response regulator
MPNMDGITLLRTVQEIDKDLVGIVMTGQGTINTAVEAMQTGALDYILKPFNLSVVLPVLSRSMRRRPKCSCVRAV